MHEMSIAVSLLNMAEEEARRHNCSRIEKIVVQYGPLSGLMPDALRMCFEILVRDTPHAGAELELALTPLRLRCPFCGAIFGGADQDALWLPCPKCGETLGHIVEDGKEMLLRRIEAAPD